MKSIDKNKKKIQVQQQKTKAPVPESNQNNLIWWFLSAVFITTFAIYFKAIKYDFLMWDDQLYITLNKHIKGLGFENIKIFFTSFYAGNYHPLTTLMYAVEYKLVGLDASLYHFNNILLHLLNTFLVFVLIRKIAPKNIYVALITAAFFAVHPMHVESVAWIAERKDCLYTFFFLLSLITYLNYLKSEKILQLILAGVFFLLSCLSKSAAVVLPLLMLLFDYYLNRKFSWKVLIEKIPFFTISLIFGILALHSQKAAMPVTQFLFFSDKIFITSNSFITYIFKAFIPINLSALYPYPIELGSTLPPIYYASIVFLGLILFFVWYSRKWGKDVIFGFLFFVITIILVLQIISVGYATMADRYTYVPYIGIFFIVGKYFEYLSSKTKSSSKFLLMIVLIIVFLKFVGLSYARIDKWKNDETLFSDVIGKYPLEALPYNNRGCYYLNISQADSVQSNTKKVFYLEKSVKDFDDVIKINTNYTRVYYNRGLARYFLKDYTNSIQDFDIEIQKNSKDVDVYFARGNAQKDNLNYIDAIKDFDKVIELKPTNDNVYFNLGNAQREMNDFSSAIKNYDKAIELNPGHLKAYNNRAILKCMLKDYEGTIADYDKMIELNPTDATIIKNREIIKSLLDNSKK